MNNKIARNSSFELLRIVAMLMIVIHHISCHCVSVQLTDAESIARMGNGFFSNPIIYKKLWLIDFGYMFGPIGNAIFILISGYFMVAKENINLSKAGQKLLTQLGFAAFILMMGSFVLYRSMGISEGLVGVSRFNTMSWYVGYYFSVIVIAKLFLNRLLQGFDKKQYIEFMLVIFAVVEFEWTGALLDGLVPDLRMLFTGLFLYSFGGYIRKYNPFKNLRISAIIVFFIAMIFCICISSYNERSANIASFIKSGSESYKQALVSFSNFNVLVLFTAIMLFELFRRINIGNSKVVNYIGGTTFMVYLIHDNELFYKFWGRCDWIKLLHDNPMLYVVNILKWGVMTFMVGVLAYVVYRLICYAATLCSRLFFRREIKHADSNI